jgi:hypothetical protein
MLGNIIVRVGTESLTRVLKLKEAVKVVRKLNKKGDEWKYIYSDELGIMRATIRKPVLINGEWKFNVFDEMYHKPAYHHITGGNCVRIGLYKGNKKYWNTVRGV